MAADAVNEVISTMELNDTILSAIGVAFAAMAGAVGVLWRRSVTLREAEMTRLTALHKAEVDSLKNEIDRQEKHAKSLHDELRSKNEQCVKARIELAALRGRSDQE